jgi:hypothetical protein
LEKDTPPLPPTSSAAVAASAVGAAASYQGEPDRPRPPLKSQSKLDLPTPPSMVSGILSVVGFALTQRLPQDAGHNGESAGELDSAPENDDDDDVANGFEDDDDADAYNRSVPFDPTDKILKLSSNHRRRTLESLI